MTARRNRAVLKPFLSAAEVKAQFVERMPFPTLQSLFDDSAPAGMQNYRKADFINELTDEAIAAHAGHGAKTPHISSSMHSHAINGAAQRVGADETAFGHRDKNFAPVIVGIWDDPADNEANIGWVKDYYEAVHPHSGSEGGYINFMSGDDAERALANYGANYERLAQVKLTYDPDNLFHSNQNIAPASASWNQLRATVQAVSGVRQIEIVGTHCTSSSTTQNTAPIGAGFYRNPDRQFVSATFRWTAIGSNGSLGTLAPDQTQPSRKRWQTRVAPRGRRMSGAGHKPRVRFDLARLVPPL